MFTIDTPIYHSYINLVVLPSIYKPYILFILFMFCFTTNIDLQVLCYIYKFLFCLLIIHQFTPFMLNFLFYFSFVSFIFHLHNFYFILHLILIYKFCVTFVSFIFYFLPIMHQFITLTLSCLF